MIVKNELKEVLATFARAQALDGKPVFLKAGKDKLLLAYTASSAKFLAQLPATGEEEWEAWVNMQRLVSIVERIEGDITLERKERSLLVKHGTETFRLMLIEASEKKPRGFPEEEEEMELPWEKFRKGLLKHEITSSVANSFGGIHVTAEEGKIRMISTDAKVLVVSQFPAETENFWRLNFPMEALKILKKTKGERVKFWLSGLALNIKISGPFELLLTIGIPNGKIPEKVNDIIQMKGRTEVSVKVPTKELQRTFASARAVGDRLAPATVKLAVIEGKGVKIMAKSNNGEYETLIPAAADRNFFLYLNPELVLKLISRVEADSVTLHFTGKKTPYFIEEEDESSILVSMPLVAQEEEEEEAEEQQAA